MKKLLIVILFLSFSMTSFAQYIEGQENVVTDEATPTTMSITQDEPRMCTMEYAPVCAEVQVQCIKAPCFPVNETFWNTCSAGNNKILYRWECNDLVNSATYKRYQKYEDMLQKKLVNISTEKLEKMLELTNKMIEQTPLLKMAMWALETRTTKLVFIKNLIQNEISTRY